LYIFPGASGLSIFCFCHKQKIIRFGVWQTERDVFRQDIVNLAPKGGEVVLWGTGNRRQAPRIIRKQAKKNIKRWDNDFFLEQAKALQVFEEFCGSKKIGRMGMFGAVGAKKKKLVDFSLKPIVFFPCLLIFLFLGWFIFLDRFNPTPNPIFGRIFFKIVLVTETKNTDNSPSPPPGGGL